MYQVTKVIVLTCLLWVYSTTSAEAAVVYPAGGDEGDVTVRIEFAGKPYYGKPLAWDGEEVVLLRRDGRLAILPATSTTDFKKVDDRFKPMKPLTIRKKLVNEYGSKYQVSVTANFVVVHPIGDATRWAQPFEKLYHRFRSYFLARGFQLDDPDFPMVAVVLRTREEFDRFLTSYHDYDEGILGYYSPKSNRIVTYDQSGGDPKDESWFFNASTIIHEATHQTAFNTGIHSRFGPVPRWISEGMAMMFEAPGINNSRYYSQESKRINRERLIALKYYYENGDVENRWIDLISDDNLFREDPSLAYAMSWGLTFYLAEKYPQNYINFLKNDAKRGQFEAYGVTDRKRDFAKYFGKQLDSLEARMQKYFNELDVPQE